MKVAGQDPDASEGRLLLFDPLGRTVEWLADGVRSLNAASVSPSGDLVILYERNRQFVTAVVNGQTLKLTQEQVFDIPPLN